MKVFIENIQTDNKLETLILSCIYYIYIFNDIDNVITDEICDLFYSNVRKITRLKLLGIDSIKYSKLYFVLDNLIKDYVFFKKRLLSIHPNKYLFIAI